MASSAGPASPIASVAITGVDVVYTPPSTIDTKKLTGPGHIGPTRAVYTPAAGAIGAAFHGSAAVDPRQRSTTSDAPVVDAVTWTPARSEETPRTAGSGRGGPASNAHARNRSAVGSQPSYPACPRFGTRLSHLR